MHALKQMDPDLYAEALRKQARLSAELIALLERRWETAFGLRWIVKPRISLEEVMEDLAYGRD